MGILTKKIFNIKTLSEFENCALEVFNYQFQHNKVYNKYCTLLKINPHKVNKLTDIPFLPIEFFKTQSIKTGDFQSEITFASSGTTGSNTSKHHVKDSSIYERSFLNTFNQFYPKWKNSAIIGLLPSYLDRNGSSLIYMVNHLIENSSCDMSGFHLKPSDELLNYLCNDEKHKILFGVTFALLDLCSLNLILKNTTIIETGGMKGQRKEITRAELHLILKEELKPLAIHSEYGMTELLSQAYLQKEKFKTPPWMKVLARETADPLTTHLSGKGALNIIDLANLHSCSFIATDDLGEVSKNGTFSVNGRIDHSQIRGCNLLML